jgi:hypothetical protein
MPSMTAPPTPGVNCVKVVEVSGRSDGWMVIGTPCEWRVCTWDEKGRRTMGIACRDGEHAMEMFRKLCEITDNFTTDEGELRVP